MDKDLNRGDMKTVVEDPGHFGHFRGGVVQ